MFLGPRESSECSRVAAGCGTRVQVTGPLRVTRLWAVIAVELGRNGPGGTSAGAGAVEPPDAGFAADLGGTQRGHQHV